MPVMDTGEVKVRKRTSRKQETPTVDVPVAPTRSSHVIDLRKDKAPKVVNPAKSITPTPKAAQISKFSTEKPAPAPVKAAKPKKAELMSRSQDQVFQDQALASAPLRRPFWPSFWKFIGLLIALGLVITAGLYLFITYYQG
jgi:hypothetical protein